MLEVGERDGDYISSFAIPVVNKNREELVKSLQDNGVEVRPLIAGNMANKPMWLNENDPIKLPNCELLDSFGFYIPNHQDLTSNQINIITKIINK